MNNGLPVAKERMMLHVTDELILMETKLNKLPDVRQHLSSAASYLIEGWKESSRPLVRPVTDWTADSSVFITQLNCVYSPFLHHSLRHLITKLSEDEKRWRRPLTGFRVFHGTRTLFDVLCSKRMRDSSTAQAKNDNNGARVNARQTGISQQGPKWKQTGN